MPTEPGVLDSHATSRIVRKLQSQFFSRMHARYGIFVRAHALQHRTGKFWQGRDGTILFTAHASGPDLELTSSGYNPEVHSVSFAHRWNSRSYPVPANLETVATFLDTLIKLGLELEAATPRQKPRKRPSAHHAY